MLYQVQLTSAVHMRLVQVYCHHNCRRNKTFAEQRSARITTGCFWVILDAATPEQKTSCKWFCGWGCDQRNVINAA
jgi:hypothetical protein